MKILRGILALLPLAITAAVLPMMPEKVPVHYNINGNVDRVGSRAELLLLPVILLAVAAVSALAMKHYEKRAESADESEARSARANRKALGVISLALPALFGALQCGVLYMTYRNARADSVAVSADFLVRLIFILVGLLCMVLGALMPKSERNNLFGFRVTWSMYNDTTWKKSNTLGGIVFIIIGLLLIVTTAFVPVFALTLLMLGYLLTGTVILSVYAYMVYKEEMAKEESAKQTR